MLDDLTRNLLEQRDNIENQRNRELNSNREAYIKKLEKENKQLKHILDELEKCLKENIKRWEQEEQKWIEHGFMKFGGEANNKIIFKKILNKLEELRGRE